MPSSLVCRPRFAIALAPCVVEPNNAARFCELLATSEAKSSNGSAALAAAVLSSTILCPKFAPVWESCLKVSILTSSLFPNVWNPSTLSVNALIDPEPSKAALPRPMKLLPTFLNPSTTSSFALTRSRWLSIKVSMVFTCSLSCLSSSFAFDNFSISCLRSWAVKGCLAFKATSSLCKALAFAVELPVRSFSAFISRSSCCSSIRCFFRPFYTHINIDIYTLLVYIYRIKKWQKIPTH